MKEVMEDFRFNELNMMEKIKEISSEKEAAKNQFDD
jgi:hypothetical protein